MGKVHFHLLLFFVHMEQSLSIKRWDLDFWYLNGKAESRSDPAKLVSFVCISYPRNLKSTCFPYLLIIHATDWRWMSHPPVLSNPIRLYFPSVNSYPIISKTGLPFYFGPCAFLNPSIFPFFSCLPFVFIPHSNLKLNTNPGNMMSVQADLVCAQMSMGIYLQNH